ncbi:glycosyltransferase family 4 protein [Tuwongella immobilis]|uniref:Glycosyl transferase family 1 domain-containing protein n=1 Tax=Tuwongella immobilis TaxID=692036 RepID=A0A6C2YQD6_9BACT|nr:glycosyltransferase family 4 protein [Tuwongella immobilis]VIP03225.1 Putative O-antigen biosynthesis protein RfbC OS=Variovorax paradoxus B4 GN=rfbC1 PE=4 SV=1: Glycos_transf_1 [Tuwongella immobilis]VTS03762.1 Putative O-antigen biosynthesis protein RfbC OS=Variovorax paradoxus B4 GN=rfbC1 PE=4 SV=1: Glycos_transf_1 [Tuwongella immobilis]
MPSLTPTMQSLKRMFSAPRSILRRARDWWRGETASSYFSIRNPRVLNPLLQECGVAPLELSGADLESDDRQAVRFILALLSSRPWFARQFPKALSAGTTGEFGKWLFEVATEKYDLSPVAIARLRAVWDADPARRVKRVYELRSDLRAAFPLGLLPCGRREYLQWLLVHGPSNLGLEPEECLWMMFELEEDLPGALAATYLHQPEWQTKFPHALTIFGWQTFQRWLQAEYQLNSRWSKCLEFPARYRSWDELQLLLAAQPELKASFPAAQANLGDVNAVLAWLRRQPVPQPNSAWQHQLRAEFEQGIPQQLAVNLIGHFRYLSGLQEAAHALGRALERANVRCGRRDIPVLFETNWADRERYQEIETHEISIATVAVNSFLNEQIPFSGMRLRSDVHRIAVWYWELEEVPHVWQHADDAVSEIWAPTRFIADAFRARFRRPVVTMLPGVELPKVPHIDRSEWGFHKDECVFLFVFDMASMMVRKNPIGLIEAFGRAFPKQSGAKLVIKVNRSHRYPQERQQLLEAASKVGATVLEGLWPRERVLGLMQAADAFVSLHRSEGLGLTMAEAMLLGKPVIASGYSGNLDFMTSDNSLLVDTKRVLIQEDVGPYPKGIGWGDPCLDHAAHWMRWIRENPQAARDLGARAKLDLESQLSLQAFGQRMLARLQQIQAERRSRN